MMYIRYFLRKLPFNQTGVFLWLAENDSYDANYSGIGGGRMRELCYVVKQEYDNVTVQTFLRRSCGVSARLLARLKRVENGITADGVHVRSIDRIRAGQRVLLKMPQDRLQLDGIELPLDIVFEDEDVLVVNKPAGIAVHPSAGHDEPTLADAVVSHFKRHGAALSFRPVNRLDRNTSGLLLAAKNAHAAHLLSRRTSKEYLAVVLGRLEGDGVIEQPIRIKEGYGITREVGEGGKYCLTRWWSLAADDSLSLVRVVIETGRTHQIRVHMAWLGHPLAGDTMYGNDTKFMKRHALHCARLGFEHPVSGRHVELTAPVPTDMDDLVREREWGTDS
jgi:23S rRNA pseudouridine1911/1915/1917 synthase